MHPHVSQRGRHAGFVILVCFGLMMAAVLAVTHPGVAQTITPLRLVSTAWPPFTNPPGKPRFALDLVETALGRGGVASTTTIVAPARFTAALLSTDFDGSAAAWQDAERERILLYSQPYLENRLVLIGRKGSDVSATTLAMLPGKRVAVVEGYSYGDIEKSGPTFVRTTSEEDSLSELLAGKVDYALMDDLVVQYILNYYEKEAESKLAIGTASLVKRQLHLAIRRSLKDAQSIVDGFNAQLRNMIADRTYHRLLHVSWISADMNGDGIPEYIPASDQAGTTPPKSAYSLSTERPPHEPTLPDMSKPGFYVGGTVYPDWAAVPGKYKIPPSPIKPEEQDPARHTASLFKFVWK